MRSATNIHFFSVAMILVFLLVVSAPSALAQGKACEDLTGVWLNWEGEELHINHDTDRDSFLGLYLELKDLKNIDNPQKNIVQGRKGKGDMVVFTVVWEDSNSSTAWVGQCMTCGEYDLLVVTWLFRRPADCIQRKYATSVNMDTFTREPEKEVEDMVFYEISPPILKPDSKGCHIKGTWYNENGGKLSLELLSRWHVVGNISRTFTQEKMNRVVPVEGRWDSKFPYMDFGFYAFPFKTVNGQVAAIWVGQCMNCKKQIFLDTFWLIMQPNLNCSNHWNHSHIGTSTFTKKNPAAKKRTKAWKKRCTSGDVWQKMFSEIC